MTSTTKQRTAKCPVCGIMFHPLGIARHIASHRGQTKKNAVANYLIEGDAQHNVDMFVNVNGQQHIHLKDEDITVRIAKLFRKELIDKGTKVSEIEVIINITPIKQ